ncbi:MAG: 4Fe-4S binding protein, partial [Clostridia bacterium]|nr:4Fe-4S binding protein [Clostridia bacterium]
MDVFTSKTACCACSACAAICPTGAITMVPDADGFLYPQVDEGKCVSCGLCERV